MSLPGADSEADCFGAYFNLMSMSYLKVVNVGTVSNLLIHPSSTEFLLMI